MLDSILKKMKTILGIKAPTSLPIVPIQKSPDQMKPKPSRTKIESQITESKPRTPSQVESVTKEQRNHKKEFLKIFEELAYQHRPLDIWRDFVTMFACAISNAVDKTRYDEREALYLHIIKKYNKKEQALFPILVGEMVLALEKKQEQDFLGAIYMDLNLGNERTAQFFTPYSVCQMMAAVTLGDVLQEVKEQGYVTINDPCCGAGANLIAGIHESKKQLEKEGYNYQNHVLIVAQDIDMTVALMCYIQISLLGMAGYIKIGNTLTEPMTPGDDLKNYWFTPIYFSEIWAMRSISRGKTLL